MLNFRPSKAGGFSLVELMITLAVLGMLIMIALPNMGDWIRNSKLRSGAESIQNGLQLARVEALRRNTTVRFQFVDSMTSSCTATMGTTVDFNRPSWVVSLDDPSGACQQAADDAAAPRILHKWAVPDSQGFPWGLTILAGGNNALVFNGLGRLAEPIPAAGPSPSVARIDVGPSVASLLGCTHQFSWSKTRCLRLTVNNGGQVRMCDPAVTDNTDPRFC